jgi:RNA polymerase sigma-70 factor, ECF subfamily
MQGVLMIHLAGTASVAAADVATTVVAETTTDAVHPVFSGNDVDLHAIAMGDRDAFRRVFTRSRRHLFALALRLLRDPALAQECLQDGYVRMWTRAASYRGCCDRQAWAWMVTVLRSRCFDALRVRLTTEQIEDDTIAEPSYAARQPRESTPEAFLLQEERDQLLRSCMQQLAPARQHVLRQAYFDGRSHSEIAHETGQPIGTIKSTIRRGLLSLRDCIERREQ